MLFSSTIFIFFFLPTVLFFYYVVFRKKRTCQNVLLLLASLFFYAWGEVNFVFIMMLSIVANYGCGLFVDKYRDKAGKLIVALSVVFNLSLLFVFKYLGFATECVNSLLKFNITVPAIALPLGISFFTFQGMSYVIDVYRGHGKVQKNILNVGLYIAFFPQLIAGPIVRYATVAEQIYSRKETFDGFSQGMVRFITGVSKKVLIANTMGLIADSVFTSDLNTMSFSYAWVGAISYTFQIFFDFGGYSDMAIGLGKMFGFEFLENFNYPYMSRSVSEFWRRWHISLGTWFRDYVYFPLGGSRVKSKSRLVFNLFVVWSLTGIWHGASWTFALWGLIYFVLIALEKLTGFEKKLHIPILGNLYTLFFVVMGWVLFRADTVEEAFRYISVMFGANGVLVDNISLFTLKENAAFFVAAIVCSTPAVKWLYDRFLKRNAVLLTGYYLIIALFMMLSVSYMVKGSYNPFIYFNF